jgi:hypothetical protein
MRLKQNSPPLPVPDESDIEAPTPTALPSQQKDPDGKQAYLGYIQSLPYASECESIAEMNDRLEVIIRHIAFV